MLARYLGSKRSIMEPLLGEVARLCPPGGHVVDAFSGSLAVSLGLKRAGYRVTANDINLFSAVLAEAYLLHDELPIVSLDLIPRAPRSRLSKVADELVLGLIGRPGFRFLGEPEHRRRYIAFVATQLWLQTLGPSALTKRYRRTDFYDAYCEEGIHSAYTSSRGRTGNRRFLSPVNATRLDLVLGQLRQWRQNGNVNGQAHALLLASVLRAVERVANTQGTYHDFPRTDWDPRALQPLFLEPPALDGCLEGVGGHRAGIEQDSLDFVSGVGPHSVLYLDPPYNFRQYTAYYFLPNVICRYPEMNDPEKYFGNLIYVRGQNPEDDFSSTFCKPARFIDDMRTLIERAAPETVLISYFNGRNHWNNFDSEQNDVGRGLIDELLRGPGFEPDSLRTVVIPRTNYASYGGFKARPVDELLLSARTRETVSYDAPAGTDHRLRAVA